MSTSQIQRFCSQCNKKTLHQKNSVVSLGMGILLTLITVGIFLPIWIILGILNCLRPWRCQTCGKGKMA